MTIFYEALWQLLSMGDVPWALISVINSFFIMVQNFYMGVSYILFWVVVVSIGISIILYNYTMKEYKPYSYLDSRLHLESTSFVHKGSPHTAIDLTMKP